MQRRSERGSPVGAGCNARRAFGAAGIGLLAWGVMSMSGDGPTPPTLEETRLAMSKWIETQQIIARERNDWQQSKEVLTGRLEVVGKEAATLEQKIQEANVKAAETDARRAALLAQNDELKAAGEQLSQSVGAMEREVRALCKRLPEPLLAKLQPLLARIPEEGSAARVSVAERFQNVLGIVDTVNKANNEISVGYEVHTLADGHPSEVRVLYVGLAQAYYVSGKGEGGIGRPGPEGWVWEPSVAIANDVTTALEILEGKHTPAFVPLPVKLP